MKKKGKGYEKKIKILANRLFSLCLFLDHFNADGVMMMKSL